MPLCLSAPKNDEIFYLSASYLHSVFTQNRTDAGRNRVDLGDIWWVYGWKPLDPRWRNLHTENKHWLEDWLEDWGKNIRKTRGYHVITSNLKQKLQQFFLSL